MFGPESLGWLPRQLPLSTLDLRDLQVVVEKVYIHSKIPLLTKHNTHA